MDDRRLKESEMEIFAIKDLIAIWEIDGETHMGVVLKLKTGIVNKGEVMTLSLQTSISFLITKAAEEIHPTKSSRQNATTVTLKNPGKIIYGDNGAIIICEGSRLSLTSDPAMQETFAAMQEEYFEKPRNGL